MDCSSESFGRILLWLLIGILSEEFSHALRNVYVEVPLAARRGDRATLKCFYDLEDDTLYSVKWYKGRREIYSYLPTEEYPMKVFELPSESVERTLSNETQLVLTGITRATAGKYSCEVSADAPSFHTITASGHLDIVDPPHQPPYINGIRTRYRAGDILNGNCTSRHSMPAANLTWFVNGEEILPPHIRLHRVQRDKRTKLETAVLKVHFVVMSQHFHNGKMKLRCAAQIHDLYWRYTDRLVMDANLPRHPDYENIVEVGGDEPYDQFPLQDGEMLRKKDSYLTRLQGFLRSFIAPTDQTEDSWLYHGGDAAHSGATASQQADAHVAWRLLVVCLVISLTWQRRTFLRQQQQLQQQQQQQLRQQEWRCAST